MSDSTDDPIDYGTGEGAAYGGSDPDTPIFIQSGIDGHSTSDEGNKKTPGNRNYAPNIGERTWRRTAKLLSWVFASPAGWSAIASVVMAVSTVVYTIYAHRQWKATSDQISQMRDTNRLTQLALRGGDQALQSQIDNFQTDERPWVVVTVMQFIANQNGGNNMTVNAWVSNKGKTPAFDVKVSRFGSTLSYKELDIDSFLKATKSKEYSGVSNAGFMVQGYNANIPQITKPLTPIQFADIRAKKLFVYTFGDIDYTDSFGGSHHTQFCGIYDAGNFSGDGVNEFHFCANHNFVDRNK